MAWSQADIEALEAAMASGVKRVLFDGPPKREKEFHSLSEMDALLSRMKRELASPPPYRRVKFGRGFGR